MQDLFNVERERIVNVVSDVLKNIDANKLKNGSLKQIIYFCLENCDLDEETILRIFDAAKGRLSYSHIFRIKNIKFTEKIIRKILEYYGSFDRYHFLYSEYGQLLSEEFLEEHMCKSGDVAVFCYCKLKEPFIEKHITDDNPALWAAVSMHQKLSEEFIEKHKDKLNWDYLYENKNIKFSNKFKLKYKLLGYIK